MDQPSPARRRAARPLEVGLGIEVHVGEELLKPLDRWIAANPELCPSRPAAVRHALREWLAQEGLTDTDE